MVQGQRIYTRTWERMDEGGNKQWWLEKCIWRDLRTSWESRSRARRWLAEDLSVRNKVTHRLMDENRQEYDQYSNLWQTKIYIRSAGKKWYNECIYMQSKEGRTACESQIGKPKGVSSWFQCEERATDRLRVENGVSSGFKYEKRGIQTDCESNVR